LQIILWRPTNKESIAFELNILTHGAALASFLATRCLAELANEFAKQLPKIAQIIRKDFYMDDLLTGANTIEKVKDITQGLSRILATAGFKLRKWISNELLTIRDILAEDQISCGIKITDNDQAKTLGTYWQAQSDNIRNKIFHQNFSNAHNSVNFHRIKTIFFFIL